MGSLGSGTQYFTVSFFGDDEVETVKVDEVRLQMKTSDEKTLLYEISIPVEYTFENEE